MSEQAHHRREDVVADLAAEVLREFGEFEFVAWGSSMIPAVFPGDTLIVRSDTPASMCPGDVVLLARARRFYAHRLVNKTEEEGSMRLITRGDALSQDDPPFAQAEMLGRVAGVIRRGKRIDLERHPGKAQKMLRWTVQHSDFATKWLLRWHSLRGRLARNFGSRSGRRLTRELV